VIEYRGKFSNGRRRKRKEERVIKSLAIRATTPGPSQLEERKRAANKVQGSQT